MLVARHPETQRAISNRLHTCDLARSPDGIELHRMVEGDRRPPPAGRGLPHAKRLGGVSLGPEMLDHIAGSHLGGGKYRMRNPEATYGIPGGGLRSSPMTERGAPTKRDAVFPPEADPKEIGKRIKALRQGHAFSQRALAELIVAMGGAPTTSKTTVWKWENGEVENIANTTLYFLVKALHTTHEFLLFGPSGEPKPRASYLKNRKP